MTAFDLQLRLARRIIAAIGDGSFARGAHLRETDLSQRFAVSRSPVRGALDHLHGLGVVERRANRGFFVPLAPPAAALCATDLPRTGDERMIDTLSADWFFGRIAQVVSEAELRARYGLGRGTAARILRAMADDGIVARLPGYGWRFEPTLNSTAANDESYDFRIMVEVGAILSPQFRHAPEAAQALRARHGVVLDCGGAGWDTPALVDLDVAFHDHIAAGSQNRFVVAAVAQQNRLRRLLEYNSLIDTGRMATSIAEHLGILDSLDAGDTATAARRMEAHLRAARAASPPFGR
ncbi:GntR family transcriptional regulator [Paracoccaceae bacterium Fryx2]|nr:GntR family transcriptional regulator [Paracoccaceae bacterium Fryx2]